MQSLQLLPRDEREGGRRDGLEGGSLTESRWWFQPRTTSRVVRSSLLLAACEFSSLLFSSLFSLDRNDRLKKLLVLALSLAIRFSFVALPSYSAQALWADQCLVWFPMRELAGAMSERSRQLFWHLAFTLELTIQVQAGGRLICGGSCTASWSISISGSCSIFGRPSFPGMAFALQRRNFCEVAC